MPSGPKKRKAAKRKKFKDSNNSNSSSTTHSHHGESDGGKVNPPVAENQHNNQLPYHEVEKSLNIRTTEMAANEEEGNFGIIGKKSTFEEEMCMVPELDKRSFLEQRLVVNGSDSKDNLSTSLVVESSLVENGAASDKQPVVACGAQGAMQTTSRFGCCGILELLSSSDR